MSDRARFIAMCLVGFGTQVLLAAAIVLERPLGHDSDCATFELTTSASSEVFGFGKNLGVTIQRQSEVRFRFDSVEQPATVFLSLVAFGFDPHQHLEVTLNGVFLGYLDVEVGKDPKAVRPKRLRLGSEALAGPNSVNDLVVANPEGAKEGLQGASANSRALSLFAQGAHTGDRAPPRSRGRAAERPLPG